MSVILQISSAIDVGQLISCTPLDNGVFKIAPTCLQRENGDSPYDLDTSSFC